MWRSFFLAIGISAVIFGVECLGVEKMILSLRETPPATQNTFFGATAPSPKPVVFTPQPFLPWTLISTGAVVCLYSFTLGKK